MSPKRTIIKLSQCAPGTPIRLFAKYRDKSPRPRFKFGAHNLGQHELTVVEHDRAGYTRVAFTHKNEEYTLPLWGELRIAL